MQRNHFAQNSDRQRLAEEIGLTSQQVSSSLLLISISLFRSKFGFKTVDTKRNRNSEKTLNSRAQLLAQLATHDLLLRRPNRLLQFSSLGPTSSGVNNNHRSCLLILSIQRLKNTRRCSRPTKSDKRTRSERRLSIWTLLIPSFNDC